MYFFLIFHNKNVENLQNLYLLRRTAIFLTSESFSYHKIVVFYNPAHFLNWLIETIAVTSAIGLSTFSKALFLVTGYICSSSFPEAIKLFFSFFSFFLLFSIFFSAFSLDFIDFLFIIISAFAVCQSLFSSNYIKFNFQVHPLFLI